MADNTEKLKAGLLKNILKEMKGANDQFEKIAQAEMAAAAEGKGLVSGLIAQSKARMDVAKEYTIATKGTLGKRQAFFEGLLGRDLGDMFKNLGLDKKESPEKIKEAREKFGLDKKEKGERGGTVGKLTKPLSLILRNVIQTQKMVRNIEKALTKPSLKAGYKFDPRMAGGGRYKNTETNKIVSAAEATGGTSARTEALTSAIYADEQPLVKLKESLDEKFKKFEDSMKNLKKVQDTADSIKFTIDGIIPRVTGLSVHSKLDLLLKEAGMDVLDDVDTPDRKRNGRTRPTRPTRPVRPGMGGLARLAIGGTAAATVGLVVGGAAYMASGKAADAAKEPMKELERKYGLKTLYDSKGNTVGYSVDGKKYGLDNLPQEYKDLILAYGPGDKRNATARDAIARINKNPEQYRMLEIGYKPKPAAAISTPPVQSKVTGAPTTAAPTSTVQRAISAVRGTVSAAVTAGSTAASKVGSTVGGAVTSAGAAVSGAASGIMGTITSAMNSVGLTNKFAQIALLANIKKESGFKPTGENLKYSGTSNDRIRKIFGSRAAKYSDEELNVIKKDEYKMGELMYGKDTRVGQSMGNKEEGDGYKYRGRGFIQLTGKNNYAAYGKQIGVDLVGSPDLANDPVIAAQIAARFIMTGLKNKINFTDQKSANMAVTKTIGGNLDLSKGYGAEILAKVDAYSNEFGNISGGSTSGSTSSGPMLASTTAPSTGPMLASVTPTVRTTGAEVTQQSRQYDTSKMVASTAAPAAPVVINNNTGGNKMPPSQPNQPLPMASTRSTENTFNRAISRDFAHPTAFTSVGMA